MWILEYSPVLIYKLNPVHSACLGKREKRGAAERGSKELQSFQLNFNSLKNIVAIHLDSPRAFLFMKEWSSVIFLDVD